MVRRRRVVGGSASELLLALALAPALAPALAASRSAVSPGGGPDVGSEGSPLSTGGPAPSVGGAGAYDGDLEGWLAAVKFVIPDGTTSPIRTTVEVLGVSITVEVRLRTLTCDGLRVGSLTGALGGGARSGGGSGGRDNLSLQADRVSLSCGGQVDYNTSLGLSGHAQGRVSTGGDGASLGVQLLLNSSDAAQPRLPDSVALRGCRGSLGLHLEVQSGTVWTELARLVPGVLGKLEGLINDELGAYVCGDGLRLAEARLGGLASEAHALAREYMAVPVPQVPEGNASWVSWQDVGLVRWVMQFQEVARESGGLSRLVDRLCPGGQLCLLGQEQGCLRATPACLFGGANDTDCAASQDLHGEPPAALRVAVESAELVLGGQRSASLRPVNATIYAQGMSQHVELSTIVSLDFEGWAGGAEDIIYIYIYMFR